MSTMEKSEGKGLNSAAFLVDALKHSTEVPDFIELTDDEKKYWPQFARARAAVDIRDMDYILIGKLARLECQIVNYSAIMDEQGVIITNPKGTPIQNPLMGIINQLQRVQLAIISSMGLNAGLSAAGPKAKAADKMKTINSVLEDDEDGLLAKP